MQLENEKYKEKVEELEKWIILLTNNFYGGNLNSVDAIEKGLSKIDEQRNHIFQLKKTLLFERKKYGDLQTSYMLMKKTMREREEFVRRNAKKEDVEILIIERQNLEENLKLLSDEVESLSQNNNRLLKDLKQRDFY